MLSPDRGTQPYDLYYAFSLLDEISRNKESGQRRNRSDILKGILCGKRERNARKLERERDSRLVRTKDPVCVVTWGRGLVLHNGDQARPVTLHITHTSPLSPRWPRVRLATGRGQGRSDPLPTLTLAPASSCLWISSSRPCCRSTASSTQDRRPALIRTASVCHFFKLFTTEERFWNVIHPKRR